MRLGLRLADRRRVRGTVAAVGVGVLAAAGLALVHAVPASAAPACDVTYRIQNQWPDGFTANLTLRNLGDAWDGWTLRFAFANGQRVMNGWSANWNQPPGSAQVTATNLDWNRSVPTGAAIDIGFNGSWTGANAIPSAFSVNGVTCGAAPPTTPPPTTSAPPPTTPPPTTPPTSPPPGDHVPNPFAGARYYVNPDWAAQVNQLADATGGTLGAAMRRIGTNATAVWLDRIAAITSGRGLRGHLDEALRQQNGAGNPFTVGIVVYNLPNRDCAALASNGELLISQNGLARYRAEYIDPIVSILADPRYRSLRIAAVVEPDSLPNLITNLNEPRCAEANSSGAYVQGIQYAVNRLHALSNVYLYLDIAHSGWLGWDSNFNPAVQLFASTIRATSAGLASVDGFITATANYTPVEEPFLPNPNLSVGGQPVRSSAFYEWNPYFDELDYATALRNAFLAQGFPAGIGMLIDTSRSGWGGPNRPTGPSVSTDLNTYVNGSRIDRRPHRGGWCNQSGAGIGFRPTANTPAGIDAYVWVKPPGESDGTSEPDLPPPPGDPNKRHDAMCDPNARNRYNTTYPTNALDNAPHAGGWFPSQFTMLVQNAFPAA